jgi:hypothetical protein
MIGEPKTYGCPDCWQPQPNGYAKVYKPCGLSNSEHRRMAKLRKRAEKQAHQLMVKARESTVLPRAIIKEVYDQAERDTRRLGR